MKKMPIYVVWRLEECYGDGKDYYAVFNNLKDAKKYAKEKGQKIGQKLYIQTCKNGQELY